MRDMLDALSVQDVEFLVVGAFALAAHGIPRATGDIDIWVRPESENARRVVLALTRFGAPLAAHGVTARDFETPGLVYQLGLPPHRIDLLTSVDGLTFEEAWPRRSSGSLLGLDVPILSREDLLTNKRASGRAKDLLDVALLEREDASPVPPLEH
jgi:hypothetical protein